MTPGYRFGDLPYSPSGHGESNGRVSLPSDGTHSRTTSSYFALPPRDMEIVPPSSPAQELTYPAIRSRLTSTGNIGSNFTAAAPSRSPSQALFSATRGLNLHANDQASGTSAINFDHEAPNLFSRPPSNIVVRRQNDTPRMAMLRSGSQALNLGNHTWVQNEVLEPIIHSASHEDVHGWYPRETSFIRLRILKDTHVRVCLAVANVAALRPTAKVTTN